MLLDKIASCSSLLKLNAMNPANVALIRNGDLP